MSGFEISDAHPAKSAEKIRQNTHDGGWPTSNGHLLK
jgi:hypothetical protein